MKSSPEFINHMLSLGFLEDEIEAIDLEMQLFHALGKLPVLHPDDLPESLVDLHNLQNRLMSRPIIRKMLEGPGFVGPTPRKSEGARTGCQVLRVEDET